MEMKALLDVAERVLDRSHYGVLMTVDEEGRPHGSWMTPTVIRGRPGYLYAVTAPGFSKVEHIRRNKNVSWLLQTKSLDEVVEIKGRATIIDNPSLKSDVLEAIGGYMMVFWKVNPEETEMTVVETKIETVDYFQPLKAEHAISSEKE